LSTDKKYDDDAHELHTNYLLLCSQLPYVGYMLLGLVLLLFPNTKVASCCLSNLFNVDRNP